MPGNSKNVPAFKAHIGVMESSEKAREMQKLSIKKRKENILKKRLLKEEILKKMTPEDWDAIVEGAIKRAKDDGKDFEVFRDTIGQKPADNVKLETNDITVDFSGLPKGDSDNIPEKIEK